MSITAVGQAAIYTKETAGLHPEENSKEVQTHHCEAFCRTHELDIVARYHDPARPATTCPANQNAVSNDHVTT